MTEAVANLDDFFQGHKFTIASEATNFLVATYGDEKPLINGPLRNGKRTIHLICTIPNCGYSIVCRCRTRDGGFYPLDHLSSSLEHVVHTTTESLGGLCSGKKSLSVVCVMCLFLDVTY